MLLNIIKRLPALLVLLLLCGIVCLYLDGWFDISFIARGSSKAPTADTQTTAPPDSGTDKVPVGTENQGDVTGAPAGTDDAPPVTDGPVIEPPAPVEIPAVSALAGYSRSYADWVPGGSWVLGEAALDSITVPGYFSSRKATEYSVTYEPPSQGKPYEVIKTPVTADAPAVTLYMGYILAETTWDNVVNVYSSDGAALGSYNKTQISPAFCRDKSGRPLFTASGAYYYLDAGKKKFALSDYNPKTDNRGALFDYTPDYGLSRDPTRQFVAEEETVEKMEPIEGKENTYTVTPTVQYTFGLMNQNGSRVYKGKFYGAYAFSGGRAAVIDEDGHLYYINASGSTVIRTDRSYIDGATEQYVIEYFMEPLSNGEESIGFYFFEHGLTRARVLTLNKYLLNYDQTYVMSDETVVLNDSGQRFDIPVGYEVVSYSSGVFLLRGRGGYGYLDYTGTWIVDPDLDEAEPFYEGLAVVKKDGYVGLIDTNGDFVIPYGQFSYISNASTGVIAAYDSDWHILYKMTK